MTITKELIETVIDQLKKNFKEAAILVLCFVIYKQDCKLDAERSRNDKQAADNREERRKHLSFVEYWNMRLQQAIDTADARLQRKK